jgi:ABC-2 type transport system ATP-binding protein
MLLGLSSPLRAKPGYAASIPPGSGVKVKRVVGYLPENVGFMTHMNAVQNLLFISRLNRIRDEEALVKIQRSCAWWIWQAQEEGGEYSRACGSGWDCGVLLKNPQVVFLDELTTGLDPDGSSDAGIDQVPAGRKRSPSSSLSSPGPGQKISSRIGIMLKGTWSPSADRRPGQRKTRIGRGKYTLEELYMKYFKEGQP